MDDGQKQAYFTAGEGMISPDAASSSSDDINLENWITYQLNRPGLEQPSSASSLEQKTVQEIGQNALFGALATTPRAASSVSDLNRRAIFSDPKTHSLMQPNPAEVSFATSNPVETLSVAPNQTTPNLMPGSSASVQAAQPSLGLAQATQPSLESVSAVQPLPETIPIIGSNYRSEAILTEGDKLSNATVGEVKNLEEKLSRDDDVASFYDDIRNVARENLKNSFGREVGQ